VSAGPLEFRARTRIVAGLGCVEQRLLGEIRATGAERVGVVADRGFADAGLLAPILARLTDVEVVLCGLVDVDPDVAAVERTAAVALANGAEVVVAIGGGSALCAGKATAMRLHNPAPLAAYEGRDRLLRLPATTIAIPTTAGSGSEVSTVVVLHDPGRERHLVIRGLGYEPEVALLDGTLLRSLPRRPLVDAALDALSHAYEALWARKANALTDALAYASARAIRLALPRALECDDAALQELLLASAGANLACGNAELGLVHALSSSPAVQLAHGYQNGVLLPHVAAFNLPALAAETRDEIAALAPLYDEIGFTARFAAGDLSSADAELMIGAALHNPFRANNRREAHEPDLRALLLAAGAPG
jgi:alcohol dehydrogenase class IV